MLLLYSFLVLNFSTNSRRVVSGVSLRLYILIKRVIAKIAWNTIAGNFHQVTLVARRELLTYCWGCNLFVVCTLVVVDWCIVGEIRRQGGGVCKDFGFLAVKGFPGFTFFSWECYFSWIRNLFVFRIYFNGSKGLFCWTRPHLSRSTATVYILR